MQAFTKHIFRRIALAPSPFFAFSSKKDLYGNSLFKHLELLGVPRNAS